MRYLKSTPDEGIILKPNKTQGLTCYVDADYAGEWKVDRAMDPRACLSRTGYINLLYRRTIAETELRISRLIRSMRISNLIGS